MWQEIQKLSSEGHIHKYAQYIAIILLIYRLKILLKSLLSGAIMTSQAT